MWRMSVTLLSVGMLALGACSSSDDGDDPEPASTAVSEQSSQPAPETAPSPEPAPGESSEPGTGADPDLSTSEVCGLVRDGIDAFNLGDLEATIDRFEEAVPLAEDLAAAQPSPDTELLLDAVRYYATIPVENYVQDSQTSPEFLLFKEFTLRECAYQGAPPEPEDTGIPA